MNEHSVVIAGGGPTGLMLAGELALAGVDVVVVERRENQTLAGSRAGGLHARSLEVLDQRGIVDPFLAEGQRLPTAGYAFVPLDLSDFPSRHNYTLGLWQNHIERILAAWVRELNVAVMYGVEVTAFTQDDTCVHVGLSTGTSVHAQYLVGCDGGRSRIRKMAGIDFPGWDATVSNLIAEVELRELPEQFGMVRDAVGMHAISRVDYEVRDGAVQYKNAGPIRVMVTEAQVGSTHEPSLQDLSTAMTVVFGTDYGVHSPTWISRFTDTTRQAASYRAGRVLLAGDAAHVHSPAGGQGLNTGLQDAVNLGWKLAQVVHGVSPATLLDSYHNERHPVAARVLRNTMAQVALGRTDDRTQALHETVATLLQHDESRRRIAGMITGLDIHYDLGEGHPLLGRRIPDLDVETQSGNTRIYTLLHAATPLLINFANDEAPPRTQLTQRVRYVTAKYEGRWELPVIGTVAAPPAVLIRPDGHVAWVGNVRQTELGDAATAWFG